MLHRAEPEAAAIAADYGNANGFCFGEPVALYRRRSGCRFCRQRGAVVKVRGDNRVTGNLSARPRPLAPLQPHPRIAIAHDVPQGAACGLTMRLRGGSKEKPRYCQRGSE